MPVPPVAAFAAPSSRIIQLDFFRGLMLVIMMLNHLRYFPLQSINPAVANFTFQPLGFTTAAEGFVFLSGLIFAMVYTPRYQREGISQFDRYVMRRFFLIYRWHIATYAIVVGFFLIPFFNQHWPYNWESQEAIKQAPFAMLLRASVLLHQTGLLDILPLYLCFIVFIPAVMRALVAGRTARVLTAVFIVWLGAQWGPQRYLESRYGLSLGWFEALAWQLMFFTGFVLGYHLRNGFVIPVKRRWVIQAACICVPLFVYRHIADPAVISAWTTQPAAGSVAQLVADRGLGAVRIINMAALSYLLYAMCQWRPAWCRASILTRLGQHSIQVFCFHILICYALMPLRPWLAQFTLPAHLAFAAVCTAALYLPVLVWRKPKPAPPA